jgi:orotate phosphoribosyltransferase
MLLSDPKRLHDCCARLAKQVLRYGAEVVCGPLLGGAFVGQAVARESNARFVFAELQAGAAEKRYRIPEALHPVVAGKKALIVDDAINAGSAAVACAREIESLGGTLVAAASLMLRRSSELPLRQQLGVPVETLVAVDWNSWLPADCPLCKAGVAIGRK